MTTVNNVDGEPPQFVVMAYDFRLTAWNLRIVGRTLADNADEALLALSSGAGGAPLNFCARGRGQYWLERLTENGSGVEERWDVHIGPSEPSA